MSSQKDGPASLLFTPIPVTSPTSFKRLAKHGISKAMTDAVAAAPTGQCVGWGIPFTIKNPLVARDVPASVKVSGLKAQWLVFLHTTDIEPLEQ